MAGHRFMVQSFAAAAAVVLAGFVAWANPPASPLVAQVQVGPQRAGDVMDGQTRAERMVEAPVDVLPDEDDAIDELPANDPGEPVVPAVERDADAEDAQPRDPNEVAKEVREFTDAAQVGWLRLSEPLRSGPPPVAGFGPPDPSETLRGVIEQIRFIGDSPMHLGIVIYLDGIPLPMSQVDELAEAVRHVRHKGKRVLFFAQAYNTPSYLFACSGDQILLQRKGMVELHGMAIEEMYYPGLFEKIGVEADMVQVGAFKGAADPYTRKTPSKEWSETMDGLLDDLYAQLVETISKSRGMNKQQVEDAMRDSMTLKDTELLKRGIVDRLVNRSLIDATEAAFGDDFHWDTSMGLPELAPVASDPFSIMQMLFQGQQQQIRDPSLVVLYMTGAIQTGYSGEGMFGGQIIGSRTMVRLLGEARDDDRIKGVVLRIDSPGGSALASEVIWQSVRELAEKKPVFVSVDGMAASGGYYIACGGQQIYVTPRSILGSIGVVSGKFVMGDLYKKVGLTVHERTRGPNAQMFSSTTKFTDEERARMLKSAGVVYDTFIDRVNRGRGKRVADVSDVAQGRVFTGRQAVANGLADKIGGLDRVVSDLAELVQLEAGTYDLVVWPRPMSLDQYFEALLGVNSPAESARRASLPGMGQSSEALTLLRATVGEKRWPVLQRGMNGMSLMREERTLMMMPAALHVRTGE